MHQTTVRFGADLWDALESECAELGLSVAQYVREAALARLVYAAGKRGDADRELALVVALEQEAQPEPRAEHWPEGQAHLRAREVRDEILLKRREREQNRPA
ncbi:MAG: hypothetical protein QOK00_1041 [Thermoleophilaceae bacterium]|jgi:hypothetical protein|nr:hypothetical protein [Thermoleophilaceae bacterium]MEA2400638.1 hypothetical protein [Thermoleophilaceae bacterium]